MLTAMATGCASSGVPRGAHYTADKLPIALAAAPRDNAQTVDLSRLSSGTGENERIDKGDVLEVTIAAGLNEKDIVPLAVRVRDDGKADIPVVGLVDVGGFEMEAAEAAITKTCIEKQLYRAPHVTVTMKKQRVNRVMVIGAVNSPGIKEIPRRNSDLLAALTMAGGLSKDAGTVVEIRNPKHGNGGSPRDQRPPPIAGSSTDGVNAVGFTVPTEPASARTESLRVDLVTATKAGTGGYAIEDGGVVNVEKRDPEPIHVLGLVKNPNRYEFPIGQDLRVLEALSVAGGMSNPVANKIYVIRKKPGSNETAIIQMNMSDAKQNDKYNLRLAPGDVVSVEQTPGTVIIDALKFMSFGFGASLPLTAFF